MIVLKQSWNEKFAFILNSVYCVMIYQFLHFIHWLHSIWVRDCEQTQGKNQLTFLPPLAQFIFAESPSCYNRKVQKSSRFKEFLIKESQDTHQGWQPQAESQLWLHPDQKSFVFFFPKNYTAQGARHCYLGIAAKRVALCSRVEILSEFSPLGWVPCTSCQRRCLHLW